MAWSELDVQRVLTEALDSVTEQFFNLADPDAKVSYRCRTPSTRRQNPQDPKALGVDVLALLQSKLVLAFEVKKTVRATKSTPAHLKKLTDDQIDFLVRIRCGGTVSSYVVFDVDEEFDRTNVESPQFRAISRLSALVALAPNIAKSVRDDVNAFVAPTNAGAKVLDAIVRAVTQCEAKARKLSPLFVELMQEKIPEINNCILWFLCDGYSAHLTLDEFREAFQLLTKMKSIPAGKELINAYTAMVKAARAKPYDQLAVKDCMEKYQLAGPKFLISVIEAIREREKEVEISSDDAPSHDMDSYR